MIMLEMKKWCKIYLIPLLSLLMLVFSCREKPDPPTYLFPSEFLPYIVFQNGSYWVYEDSATGALDSVVVSNYVREIAPVYEDDLPVNDIIRYNEVIRFKTYSFFNSREHQMAAGCLCTEPTPGNSCFFLYRHFDHPGESRVIFLAVYDFHLEQVGTIGEETIAIYPLYSVDSHVFENVVKTVIPVDDSESGYTTYYYLGKGAGIIRKEVQTASGTWRIWKLKRYHAVR
jgi:hypothetical protein